MARRRARPPRRSRRASSLTRRSRASTHSVVVSASRPSTPSVTAWRNGSVGLATVGVAHSAASSHLMALLASLNGPARLQGGQVHVEVAQQPRQLEPGQKGRRTRREPKRASAGVSGRWPPSHSSTVGVAVQHLDDGGLHEAPVVVVGGGAAQVADAQRSRPAGAAQRRVGRRGPAPGRRRCRSGGRAGRSAPRPATPAWSVLPMKASQPRGWCGSAAPLRATARPRRTATGAGPGSPGRWSGSKIRSSTSNATGMPAPWQASISSSTGTVAGTR